VANEGKLIAIVPSAAAPGLLAAMREHPLASDAAIIGQVVAEHPGVVVMNTRVGGDRVVDMLAGEQLPRICWPGRIESSGKRNRGPQSSLREAMKRNAGEEKKREDDVEARIAPPGEVVYEAIYREGEHELRRPASALALSGLSAGLSMGFSFLAEGLLRSCLPDAPWAPAVEKLGYAVGFIIVILGRQQLFTKNTLTVILPGLEPRGRRKGWLGTIAKLWTVIFATNLAGAVLFAALMAMNGLFSGTVRNAFDQIGTEAIQAGFGVTFVRAVLAGWLIALMIWLLPFAETARLWVITILAYVVGLGHLPHIVAGAVPVFYSFFAGTRDLSDCLAGFVLPTLLGNIVGGLALVAAGAHAEFVREGKAKA
jgi:formate/nitrite transporter FocA (FNT family)